MSSDIPDTALTTKRDIKAITRALILRNNRLVPAGSVEAFAGSVVPSGWLMCNGASISKTDYYHLYDIIGDAYGSGDEDNFVLPDLRSRQVVGAGQGNGLSNRSLAQTGGEESHTLTINEMPAHTHTQTIRTGNQSTDNVFGSEVAANETSGTVTTGSTGGSMAHNVMDPFLVLNYIIKY